MLFVFDKTLSDVELFRKLKLSYRGKFERIDGECKHIQ